MMGKMDGLAQQLAELNEATSNTTPRPVEAAAAEQPAKKAERLGAPDKGKAADQTAWQRQAKEREAGKKVHVGAWLHEDFKRGVLMVRAQTGEDVQELFARVLNAEFKARKIPVVES